VLLAGAIVLMVTGTVAGVFYVSVIRAARGLPAYTAGIPPATVARPAASRRAVYRARLEGPPDRRTPAGTPSVAHRWRVMAYAAPDDALCHGAADDDLLLVDETGSRGVVVPVPAALYLPAAPRAVPPRLVAVCPDVADRFAQGGLEYVEDVVPPGALVEVVACLDRRDDPATLGSCGDGAPSRIYPRESRATARGRVRGAMLRVVACAGAFVIVCFGAGILALRRFDRDHRREGRVNA
jgi:hypothetical protein